MKEYRIRNSSLSDEKIRLLEFSRARTRIFSPKSRLPSPWLRRSFSLPRSLFLFTREYVIWSFVYSFSSRSVSFYSSRRKLIYTIHFRRETSFFFLYSSSLRHPPTVCLFRFKPGSIAGDREEKPREKRPKCYLHFARVCSFRSANVYDILFSS